MNIRINVAMISHLANKRLTQLLKCDIIIIMNLGKNVIRQNVR